MTELDLFGSFEDDTKVRLSRPSDMNCILSIDLKCYHYPLELSFWQEILKTTSKSNMAVVIESDKTATGFAQWSQDKGSKKVCINRLGVLPVSRRKGFGRKLVESIEGHANKLLCDKLSIAVPETHCCPGDPDDVSSFLASCGFLATGDLVKNYQKMYGRQEDGIIFEKEVSW